MRVKLSFTEFADVFAGNDLDLRDEWGDASSFSEFVAVGAPLEHCYAKRSTRG